MAPGPSECDRRVDLVAMPSAAEKNVVVSEMMGVSSNVSVRRGPMPVGSELVVATLAHCSYLGNLPSGHSVRLLPSSEIEMFRMRVGLCRRRVSRPRTIANWPSRGACCGRPRKSVPVDGPRRKMTGSVSLICKGAAWFDLTMVVNYRARSMPIGGGRTAMDRPVRRDVGL